MYLSALIPIGILISVVEPISGQGAGTHCSSYRQCGQCVRGGSDCMWCADEDFLSLYPSRTRCDTKSSIDFLCKKKIFPASEHSVPSDGNKPVGSDVQVNPQKIDLKLRPGQPAKFQIQVRSAENYPADLYFLIDLTGTMDVGLKKFVKLDVGTELRKVTNKFQLGFGSFSDKTVMPYIDIATLRMCTSPTCIPYAFRHALTLTSNESAFKEVLAKQGVVGNNDFPEASFDGFMQIAVCDKQIGWKPIDTSRRLVVLLTDSTYHMAGDGKLGGIITPNDGKCHLDSKNHYSKENDLSYPSVSFLKEKLKKSKIVPVLAITGSLKDSYQALADQWSDTGAVYGVLADDYSNLLDLVAQAYNKIASTVQLVDDSPSNVDVEYKAIGCKNGVTNICRGVEVGSVIKFDISVTARECTSKTQDSFIINVPGFGDVKIQVSYVCTCDCETSSKTEPSSPKCNGDGSFTCGTCYCNPGRFGDTCKCDNVTGADDRLCRPYNNTGLPVCSGVGTCICGQCSCNRRDDPNQQFSGKYCECNNFGCERYNGEVCGGPNNGKCVCGKCVCKGVWVGSNCGKKNCTKVAPDCLYNGLVCNGHGKCECGTCNCDSEYSGKRCESCPGCTGICELNQPCIMCQAFKEGDPEFCKKCSLDVTVVNDTLKDATCNVQDSQKCLVRFKYKDTPSGNLTFVVQKERKCPVLYVYEPNVLFIVLGTIGGIVLFGLIALLLWKLLISAYDRYEYNRFQKESAKARWERTENPLYIPSKQRFENPTYAGTSDPSS